MFSYSVCDTPFIWRHVKAIHLYSLFADGCLNLNIPMVFCTVCFITINVEPWMISRTINNLNELDKVIITIDFKAHLFMTTNNSLTKITNRSEERRVGKEC